MRALNLVAVSINETMGTCWRTLHRHMYRPGAPQHIFLDKKARALSHFIPAAHLSAATFTAIFCQNIQIQVGSELTIAGQKNNVLFQYHWIRSQKQERILGYAQWQEQGRTISLRRPPSTQPLFQHPDVTPSVH
jgi:hypothetical protein